MPDPDHITLAAPPGKPRLNKPAHLLNIGEAAKQTGLTPKMIRYYEDQGLFTPHTRTLAGYRQYAEPDLHALHFIRSARDLGFSVKQVAELTELWRNHDRASSEVKKLAMDHIQALENKAAILQRMANSLKILAQHCHGDERPDCPILDGLQSQDMQSRA